MVLLHYYLFRNVLHFAQRWKAARTQMLRVRIKFNFVFKIFQKVNRKICHVPTGTKTTQNLQTTQTTQPPWMRWSRFVFSHCYACEKFAYVFQLALVKVCACPGEKFSLLSYIFFFFFLPSACGNGNVQQQFCPVLGAMDGGP